MNDKSNKILPFDARNIEDFNKVTEKIHAALTNIETDKKIPATTVKLSELSGCTRKTLYNRKWPIERLEQIQTARKKAKEAEKQRGNHRGYYENVEEEDHSESAIIARIETLQKENGKLFDCVQSLEMQLKTSQEIVRALEQDNAALRENNFELHGKMRQNNQAALSSNVIELNSRLK